MLEKVQIVEKVTLREIRTLADMNQEDFAKFLGIPYTTYRRYEADAKRIDFGTLLDICNKTGVPIEKIKV